METPAPQPSTWQRSTTRRFFCWLFSWRTLRRGLVALACVATLVALFYAVEDWRGKRAWEKFKRECEAKGFSFDRASVIPPPVPADQNFALTPIVASSYAQHLDPIFFFSFDVSALPTAGYGAFGFHQNGYIAQSFTPNRSKIRC